jgi:hypothetical protein
LAFRIRALQAMRNEIPRIDRHLSREVCLDPDAVLAALANHKAHVHDSVTRPKSEPLSIVSSQRAQWSYVRVGGRLVRVDALAMDDDEVLDPRFRSGRMHSRTTTALSPCGSEQESACSGDGANSRSTLRRHSLSIVVRLGVRGRLSNLVRADCSLVGDTSDRRIDR